MNKRIQKCFDSFKYKDTELNFNIGTLVLMLMCSFLIVIATFIQFPLAYVSVPDKSVGTLLQLISNPDMLLKHIKHFYYIPQIPVILFIGGLLGQRLGSASVLIYIIAGLIGFPIFALGGGFDYYTNPSFGYILGYVLAVWLVGSILRDKFNLVNVLKALIVGVLAVHLCGVFYIILYTFIEHDSLLVTFSWIWLLSGMQILYDFVIGFMAILLSRLTKRVLWIAIS